MGMEFPFGTIIVNVSGALFIGIIGSFLIDHFYLYASEIRAAAIIGFLGGYTTFSSFSFETLSLIINGEMLKAFINIIASVCLCLLATWLGLLIGRAI